MLVIADKNAVRVSRQGCFAGAAQTKKDGRIAVLLTFTEQCIGMTRLAGKVKFNMEKTDFLVSPA